MESAGGVQQSREFHTGRKIPSVGLGTYLIDGQQCVKAVKEALAMGYRHIDTASMYGNEIAIGKAISQSGIPRGELFITSKLTPSEQGFDKAIHACQQILKRLNTDYLDLLLIHWPGCSVYDPQDKRNADMRLETWRAMTNLKKQGKVRDIGVSNFLVHHLEHLAASGTELPVINQIQLHPLLWEGPTIEYCRHHNIVIEAYSPLAHNDPKLMKNQLLGSIAEKHNRSVAQIAIRWSLQNGFVTIPKSKSKKHLEDNLTVLDFELSGEQMQSIRDLNCSYRTDWNPHSIDF